MFYILQNKIDKLIYSFLFFNFVFINSVSQENEDKNIIIAENIISENAKKKISSMSEVLQDSKFNIIRPVIVAFSLAGIKILYDIFMAAGENNNKENKSDINKEEKISIKIIREIEEKLNSKISDSAFSKFFDALYLENVIGSSCTLLLEDEALKVNLKKNKILKNICITKQNEMAVFSNLYSLVTGIEKTWKSLKNIYKSTKEQSVFLLSFLIGVAYLKFTCADRFKKTINGKIDGYSYFEDRYKTKELIAMSSVILFDYFVLSVAFDKYGCLLGSYLDQKLTNKDPLVTKNIKLGSLACQALINPWRNQEKNEILNKNKKLHKDMFTTIKYINTLKELFKSFSSLLSL